MNYIKSYLTTFLTAFCLIVNAQDFNQMMEQSIALTEANAPRIILKCTNNQTLESAYLKLIVTGISEPYYIVGLIFEDSSDEYMLKLPINNMHVSLVGRSKYFKYDPATNTLSMDKSINQVGAKGTMNDLYISGIMNESDGKFIFKSLGTVGTQHQNGYDVGSSNNWETINPRNSTSTTSDYPQICKSCNGTGKCGTCKGTGSYLNGYTGNMLECTHCSASNGRICTICNGTGKW